MVCLQSANRPSRLSLVLWEILMPLTSWLSGAYVPMWLHSRAAGIGQVRSARLIGLARFASVGIFRIASLRPNGHRKVLQFFSNQMQFVDDLFSYLVSHIAPPWYSTRALQFHLVRRSQFAADTASLVTGARPPVPAKVKVHTESGESPACARVLP